MSFEKWENDLFDSYYGFDEYQPDEDCECGCEGDYEDCTYDPEEEHEIAKAEAKLDQMEADNANPDYNY